MFDSGIVVMDGDRVCVAFAGLGGSDGHVTDLSEEVHGELLFLRGNGASGSYSREECSSKDKKGIDHVDRLDANGLGCYCTNVLEMNVFLMSVCCSIDLDMSENRTESEALYTLWQDCGGGNQYCRISGHHSYDLGGKGGTSNQAMEPSFPFTRSPKNSAQIADSLMTSLGITTQGLIGEPIVIPIVGSFGHLPVILSKISSFLYAKSRRIRSPGDDGADELPGMLSLDQI
jgi:hypothetical protein